MTTRYEATLANLSEKTRTWLVTGAAGFIGSSLTESLLRAGQHVVGLDNFSNGRPENLEDVRAQVGDGAWGRFRFIEGDITDVDTCRMACTGANIVLHQAALGSVPRSIADPIASHRANVDGFLHMLVAAKDAGVRRFVYAGSSSTYGDHPALPKVEDQIGKPLSPYAATKYFDEVYADVFARTYDFRTIGLRYFNVFGRRQRPDGPYAAVIPKWIATLLAGDRCVINGDGHTSRDFSYIENVVQANLLAGTTENEEAVNQVYNVAYGDRTTLNELYYAIRDGLAASEPSVVGREPIYEDFRPGDVRHSLADISKARRLLGYDPTHTASEGLAEALAWYVEHARAAQA